MYFECVSPRLLALLIAGAALSAGCGQAAVKSSSQAKPKPSQNQGLIAESAAATADAGTARAAYTMKMTGLAGASGGVTATGTGAVDFASRSTELQLHMTVPQAGMTVDMSERMVGTTLYMHSPLLSGATGKPWIKLDLQKLGKSQGIDFSTLLSQDPSQSFAQLQASGDVTKVGDETIDGVDTTHYRGRIDLAKLPQAAKIKALANAKYGPYDVWIGKDDGYVYRVRTSYSYVAGGARQSVTSTTNYSDFGKEVNVTVPSDDESVDATKSGIKGLGG